MSTYERRYQAINDALWLVQHGARDPRAQEEKQGHGSAFATYFAPPVGSPSQDPRYAEVGLALDIARFLMDEGLVPPLIESATSGPSS